jgi:hypothetical protein
MDHTWRGRVFSLVLLLALLLLSMRHLTLSSTLVVADSDRLLIPDEPHKHAAEAQRQAVNDIPAVGSTDTSGLTQTDPLPHEHQSSWVDWVPLSSPVTTPLWAVWGSSNTDVLAVGQGGVILEYNGSDWAEMNSGTSATLFGVWRSHSGDGFAVGEAGTILSYDGSEWIEAHSGITVTLRGVWGSDGSNVFAVGFEGTILKFDGSEWSPMHSGTSEVLHAVWGSGPDDVFAVGNSGTILHYDGSEWNSMSGGGLNTLTALGGTSGSDVYATSDIWWDQLLHYDGDEWSPVWTPGAETWRGVWVGASSGVFIVGWRVPSDSPRTTAGVIARYDGTSWTQTQTDSELNDVWGSASGDVYAVGHDGTIVHSVIEPPTHSVSGFVRDSLGTGISGVTVSAGSASSAVTSYLGHYTITGLVPGSYSVTAARSGWTFTPSVRTVGVPPNAVGQNFTGVQSGSSFNLISGYVRDYEGNPISGAIVSCDPGWGVALTDANGYYEIDPMLRGVYVVSAVVGQNSLSPAARVVRVPPSAVQQNFTTVPQYGSLTGMVKEKGTLQPIRNARVSVGGAVGFTDEAGRYALTEILPGTHTLNVSASGYESLRESGFSVSENDILTKDIQLQSVRSQGYYLPYPAGSTYTCTQGNNSRPSHLGNWRYAFDFNLANGDAVVASLEGRVVEIVEKYTESQACGDSSCIPFANYVRVRHADGYDTLYLHVNHNSVTRYVQKDQFVRRGQQIAESNNTGWTTNPHLDITRHEWGSALESPSQPLAFVDVPGDGVPVLHGVYTSANHLVDATTANTTTVADVPPRGTVDLILNGTPTHTLEVRAFGYLSDVTEMKLSNSEADFEVANWEPYVTNLPWTHPSVYAQFRDGNGNLSEVVSDMIDAVGYESIEARFVIGPTVCVNAPLDLANRSSPFCQGCRWLWDFGNGVTSTTAEPQFDFSGQTSFYGYWSPGAYMVTLSVSNAFTTTSYTQSVQALPQPSADFTLRQEGNTITVESQAPDATSWLWTFGDGAASTGRVARHTYAAASTPVEYLIQLVVENDHGCASSSYQSVSTYPAVYLPLVLR